MQNSSQPPLYRILAKFDMKGKWAVMANVIACVLLLVGFGVSWFLFPFNSGDLLPSLIKIGGGILIGCAAILLTSVFKLIILKANGSGKIKVHLGMVCDVYTTFPVRRTAYFLIRFSRSDRFAPPASPLVYFCLECHVLLGAFAVCHQPVAHDPPFPL